MTPQEQACLEAHRRLDAAGIPPAAGQICDDPECNTHLGHRVHVLVQQRDELLAALESITASLAAEVRKNEVRVSGLDGQQNNYFIQIARAVILKAKGGA